MDSERGWKTAFSQLAELGEKLAATRSRLELTRLVAELLQGLEPAEVLPAVRLILGQPFPAWEPRTLNLSWQAVSRVLNDLTAASEQEWRAAAAEAVDGGEAVQKLLERARRIPILPPPLSLGEVYATLVQIAESVGTGSRQKKESLLQGLLLRATPLEAKYLVKNIIAEMRYGVNEGLMLEAIAAAASAKPALVKRAHMFWGDLSEVAEVALREGGAGLKKATVRLFHPLQPMLAQTVETMAEALGEQGSGQASAALEYKLDGARVQIHKRGEKVCIYSRQLAEVTPSLPEIVDWVRGGVAASDAILEGEAIAVDSEGRPLPFQQVMRRFGRVHDVAQMVQDMPVALYLFDLLYADGKGYVDVPYAERWEALGLIAPRLKRAPRLVPTSLEEAERFAQEAYEAGHEGVMVKQLSSQYTPGLRGRHWLKLKHTLSLDLVIVAADWGYGRRHRWLSNYHLAAWDEEKGHFLEVGKTFKGLTDAEFEDMTQRLLTLEKARRGGTVWVEPRIVVEVLYNELQESPRYEAGLALRFARIGRLREDKSPHQADTIQTLRRLYARQHKGRI